MVRLDEPRADTAFASAVREGTEALEAQRLALLAEPHVTTMLEAMPGPAMVLNTRRQILLANRLLLGMLGASKATDLLGLRPGEAARCIHNAERRGGCGTAPACGQCGAVRSVLDCFSSGRRASHECRLTVAGDSGRAAMDLRVHATPLTVGIQRCAVVALEDTSAEKRRAVLEQVFLHDLANACLGVRHLAELMLIDGGDAEVDGTRKRDLLTLATSSANMVASQRDLLAAERGELVANRRELDVRTVLAEVLASFAHDPVAESRIVSLEPGRPTMVHTDPVLLGRVVSNLVRNALEATPAGGSVTLYCGREYGGVTISVHNESVIPLPHQHQVFQRSFTTREGHGRGLGTYSAKLLTERYLGGALGFVSGEHTGTVFVLTLP